MDITETPPRVLAACYLTKSIPIRKERVSEKDIDLGLPGVQEVSLKELGCLESSKNVYQTDKTYLLIPQKKVKDFISTLYKKSDITQAQEVLEFLEEGSIDGDVDIESFKLEETEGWRKKSTDIESKSYRLSIELYVKIVEEAFDRERSVSDVMKEYLKEGIEDMIDRIESLLDISQERKQYLQEELDSWIKGTPPKAMYKLESSYIPTPEKEEITQIEYKLVEEYLRETARKHMSEEYVKKLMSRVDINYLKEDETENLVQKIRMNMGLNSDPGVMFSNCLREVEGKVKMDVYRVVTVDFEGDEEAFQEIMDEIEHDEEFLKDLANWHENGLFIPEGIAFDLVFGKEGSYLGYFDLDIGFCRDEEDGLTLSIDGIPFDEDDFAEKLTNRFNEKRDEWMKTEIDNPEELKNKVEEHTDKGEWSKARELNERLMVLEKIDDFHHFYAKLVDELTSQVTTITANKNFFPFVEGIRISDLITEG